MTAVATPMQPPLTRKPRLHRLGKIYLRTPLYFLTLCTHHRAKLLANESIYTAFKEYCQHARDRGVQVGNYVLMPDHVHFFVSIAESGPSLSIWIKSFKNSLSKTLRAQGKTAPHWQKGFFDHLVRSADSFSEKWDYVQANPVRAGLASSPKAWPFQGFIHELQF